MACGYNPRSRATRAHAVISPRAHTRARAGFLPFCHAAQPAAAQRVAAIREILTHFSRATKCPERAQPLAAQRVALFLAWRGNPMRALRVTGRDDRAPHREMEGCAMFDSCRICGNPPPLDRDYDLCAECLDCETEIMEMSGFAIWRTESSIHAFGYRG